MTIRDFENIPVDSDWAFDQERSVSKWTHGYHRYPAKFLPNVVEKLIELYHPQQDGVIADLFAGCGTTLIEAKAHGYASIGTDINPIAILITRVKTTPINPDMLLNAYKGVVEKFDDYTSEAFVDLRKHERIDYWFTKENKYKIAFLYQCTNEIENVEIKEFFLVAISHILKNCSRWLQSSTKPQVDPNKEVIDPFEAFKQHCQQMMNGNRQFYLRIQENHFENVPCEIIEGDARRTGIPAESVDTIITSPPYVTS